MIPETRRSAGSGTATCPPILRAINWSTEAAAGPFEVSGVHVIKAQSDCGCPLPPCVLSRPLSTRTSSRKRAIGDRHGVMS